MFQAKAEASPCPKPLQYNVKFISLCFTLQVLDLYHKAAGAILEKQRQQQQQWKQKD